MSRLSGGRVLMREFAEFLAGQPPFGSLDADDLERLAGAVEVEYFGAGEVIVVEGSAALDHLFVVRTGEVEIVDRGRVVDVLGTGDTFGYISVLTGLAPDISVRASEDTLCYRLPNPRTILVHPERLTFAHSRTVTTRQRLTDRGLMSGRHAAVERHMRPLIWCDAATSVREAALEIGKLAQSCALIRLGESSDGAEVGIVTDRDFRERVATGEVSPDAPIATIATRPVIRVAIGTPMATALLRMVESAVHHLVVDDDAGRAIGVVRAIDVASVEVRDPLLIRAAIDGAHSVAELAQECQLIPGTLVELHDTEVPARHIGALHATIIDAVLRKLVQLVGPASNTRLRHSWLVLGSMARHEPLPESDVDTAIVWVDPSVSAEPADEIRKSAGAVLDAMQLCGLRRCPDGANADNPLFSRSRSAWQERARTWITDPTQEGALLLSAIAADSRPVTEPLIGRAITDSIRETTRGVEYLAASLRHTLSVKPPVGFVRDFVVEHSGRHRGRLDLKRGGLVPVTSLGRWLAVAMGEVHGTTPERIERAAAANLLTKEEADMLVGAFDDVYATVLDSQVGAIRTGAPASTWIDPRKLDSLARRRLRESFRAIAGVQNSVEGTWMARLA